MSRPSDLAFYPLLHLYRHGVELALKQLSYDMAKYNGDGGGPELHHRIAGLWETLKPDLDRWIDSRRYDGEPPPGSTEFGDIMLDLIRVEPTGFPSRYPTEKSGADIHPKLSTVDFTNFVHAVRRSESTLRAWMHQLHEEAAIRADHRAGRRRTNADSTSD